MRLENEHSGKCPLKIGRYFKYLIQAAGKSNPQGVILRKNYSLILNRQQRN